ncbi:MAG: Hpt domain-containing protein [Bdellovibrionota bacterium]
MTFEIPKASIDSYLQRRFQDLDKFKEALTKKDADVFMKIGHQIKGNGVTFGFPGLSDLGMKMEQAASAHSYEKLQALVSEYETQIQAAKKKLES